MRTRQEISKHISIAYNMYVVLDYACSCSINYLSITTSGYNYYILYIICVYCTVHTVHILYANIVRIDIILYIVLSNNNYIIYVL